MRLLRGLLLKPTLNLLSWILRRNGNSIIIGGPLGWSWQSTLDTAHHGSLAGPANAHRHGDLANIGIDDHHARDHATRHQDGGADEINLAGLDGEPSTLTTHKGDQAAGVHGSTSAATANKLMHRDASGRAKVAAPSASDDIAQKAQADAVQTNLDTHAGLTTAHSAVSTAAASRMVVRDASARAKFAAPAAAGDALIKGTAITTTELPNLTQNKIWQGDASNRPAEVNVPVTFELVASATPSAASEVAFSGLSGKLFLLYYELMASAQVELQLTLNGVTTTTYDRIDISSTAVSTTTGVAYFRLHQLIHDVELGWCKGIGQILITGERIGATANTLGITALTLNPNFTYPTLFRGLLKGSGGNLSSLRLYPSAGNFTGTVKLYKVM